MGRRSFTVSHTFASAFSADVVQDKSAYFVEAGGEAGLLGRGVNDSVVESPQSLAWHSFEGPWTQTHAFRAHLQFHHVVSVHCTLEGKILYLTPVLDKYLDTNLI